ncbi:PAS domain S-box protein [Mesorhizobium sp. AR10]|uniref:PAS domain-containing sensor histidine kinase n=1 Tax=Mesorhizobium sp. AR10 TaxID=2865839 RepID=UPI00215DFAC4|nr:ATP-binding protein [Mesorhizobium sp. AR10]UVK40707.1 PAS domain S-box protein [Mesorhizobium sp. AR10]
MSCAGKKGTIAMAQMLSPPASVSTTLFPVAVGLLAIGIFTVDTLVLRPHATAALYAVVVLLSVNFLHWRGVLLVSLGCAVLAILGYLVQHGPSYTGDPFVRLLVSLLATGTTAFLALKNQAGAAVSRERARLLDLTHDTIFVRDMNDVITYWNLGAAELYGWQGDQAIGRVSHQLMETIFPAPLEEINAELLRTGRWEGELVHARRDRPPLVVASRWSLQRDDGGRPLAILETNNDITERKRVEEALRRSEAYLTEAQRLSRTGSFGWDVATGEIIWSDETFRIFGYDKAPSVTIDMVVQRTHPDDRAAVRQTVDCAVRYGKDFAHEYRLLMPDGSVRHAHAVAHATKNASGDVEFVGAITDVTATRRAEEALHRSQAELAHVTRVTTLGELAASIAHEVNQPLAAIVTNGEVGLQWLDREVPDLAEVRETLRDMISDGRRAGEIIHRLRALSKRTETQKVGLDINDAISEVIPLVQHEVLSRRVSLRLELAPKLPAVLGDRVQLQQVIINLIVNGMEAMAPVIDRSHAMVIRSQLDHAGQVLVAVEDAGVGIDPANVRQIFEPFFTTKPSGMGMGLSICRSIMENHGGRLWASRNAGHGATFQFALPPHHDVARDLADAAGEGADGGS